ncbi:MAG: hypothetical protein ACYC3F_01030 [Gemmatimonadaceae bacterium]
MMRRVPPDFCSRSEVAAADEASDGELLHIQPPQTSDQIGFPGPEGLHGPR